MNEATETNRTWWDEAVALHVAGDFYDVAGFRAGRCTLDPIELDALGDVTGKSLLHLQCHFGMDTLSWARRGAKVTGLDFSGKAIEQARALAAELALDATFVCSPVQRAAEAIGDRFDIVYTSQGVLTWIDDLRPWGEAIGKLLKPGGVFYIYEYHPLATIWDDQCQPGELKVRYRYFGDGTPEVCDTGGGSYGSVGPMRARRTHEWPHPISEIVTVLLDAGLMIGSMHEYAHSTYRMLPGMERRDDGLWYLPAKRDSVPLMFSLTARKPID